MFILTVAEYRTRNGCIEGEAENFGGEWQEGKELTMNHKNFSSVVGLINGKLLSEYILQPFKFRIRIHCT
jgi:hypothetical protein